MQIRRRLVVATMLLTTSVGAKAYETDFHYGLTYWLAAHAGFNALQSHDLARGNERVDTGMLDAKHAIVSQLCLKRDETAAELTREFHFRSQVRVPAAPSQRPVDSSMPFASAAVKSVMAEEGTEERDRLIRFGRALHGWQDTFSHRGEPSALPLCPTDWTWAHPKARHGALSHDADLTYIFDKDCLEAARTSYEMLLEYRRVLKLPISAPEWQVLEAKAIGFCKAATKTEKEQWLTDEQVPQAQAIAKNTNLPDGTKSFRRAPLMDLGERVPAGAASNATVPMYEAQAMGAGRDPEAERKVQAVLSALTFQTPPAARDWFESFFQTWLSTPLPQLAQALSPYFGPGVQMLSTGPPIDALMRLRIADRGQVATVGTALFQVMSQPDAVVTAFSDWRSLLVPVRGRNQAVLIENPTNDGAFIVAIAVLRHAPYDVLMLVAGRDAKSFRIKEVHVFAFH